MKLGSLDDRRQRRYARRICRFIKHSGIYFLRTSGDDPIEGHFTLISQYFLCTVHTIVIISSAKLLGPMSHFVINKDKRRGQTITAQERSIMTES